MPRSPAARASRRLRRLSRWRLTWRASSSAQRLIECIMSREASRARYAPGTEFQIGRIEMIANTGTYVDAPFHRYPEGPDLAGLPLASLADLPCRVVRFGAASIRAIEDRFVHLRRASHFHDLADRRWIDTRRSGNERHFSAAARRFGRERKSHPAARSIADVADRVDILECRSSRHQHTLAAQRALRAENRLGRRDDFIRLR